MGCLVASVTRHQIASLLPFNVMIKNGSRLGHVPPGGENHPQLQILAVEETEEAFTGLEILPGRKAELLFGVAAGRAPGMV